MVTAAINVGGKLLYTLAYPYDFYISHQESWAIHNDVQASLLNTQQQFPGQEVTANVFDGLHGEIIYKVVEDFN